MNNQDKDILCLLYKKSFNNQREMAAESGHSLGIVNKSLMNLQKDGYIDADHGLTKKAYDLFAQSKPKSAVILAAGYGMRMAPINTETPKGLIEVHGEPLIERMIGFLHEAGITDIHVVTGFMKESYEYLIDDYGVKLIINRQYAEKNNLHSLRLAADHLERCYVIPCDVWCEKNPFSSTELYSWYMVNDIVDEESTVRATRKQLLAEVAAGKGGNGMIGISYINAEDYGQVRARLEEMDDAGNEESFWEDALFSSGIDVYARVVHANHVMEINTFEQLRELDDNSDTLNTKAIQIISDVFHTDMDGIEEVTALKKGMTNRSFMFSCKGRKYIMRIPGEGTDKLINRREEASVYHTIKDLGICDDILYINPETGYKITAFIPGARVADAYDPCDVKKTMTYLRRFHEMNLKVDHTFDIFALIDFYESLWNGAKSAYRDYAKTKANVLSLRSYIEEHAEPYCLTHIDAVPDNFLFSVNEKGEEQINLIDWEYAGMQDPHVDIAMYSIYALYNKEQIDTLIDTYFTEGCAEETRTKIYCYVAACGLLWSNWCEYKRSLGVEFGEYSLLQYRYAKEFYKHALSRM